MQIILKKEDARTRARMLLADRTIVKAEREIETMKMTLEEHRKKLGDSAYKELIESLYEVEVYVKDAKEALRY